MNVLQGFLSAVSPSSDGDFADRLNYCYTTLGLIATSAFISGWSFVGQPIQCWFPAYYKGWWMEYALDYCYVQNTYFVPFTDETPHNAFDFGVHTIPIPTNYTQREATQIGYYQWVPFILALQAMLFYAPVLIWRVAYEASGIKVRAICDMCSTMTNAEVKARDKNMAMVASFLTQEHSTATYTASRIRRVSVDSFLVISYLMMKALNLLNAVLQFVLLKTVLGVDSYMWGFEVAVDLMRGVEWPETGNFPRVTLCDYDVRVLGNMHRHTVQCVLMINMFNEKIFVALWFWLLALAVVNVISFFSWLGSSLTSGPAKKLVNVYLAKIDLATSRQLDRRGTVQQFVSDYLRPDGVFLVRLVSKNAYDLVMISMLKALWQEFVKNRGRQPPPYSEPLLIGAAKKLDESEL